MKNKRIKQLISAGLALSIQMSLAGCAQSSKLTGNYQLPDAAYQQQAAVKQAEEDAKAAELAAKQAAYDEVVNYKNGLGEATTKQTSDGMTYTISNQLIVGLPDEVSVSFDGCSVLGQKVIGDCPLYFVTEDGSKKMYPATAGIIDYKDMDTFNKYSNAVYVLSYMNVYMSSLTNGLTNLDEQNSEASSDAEDQANELSSRMDKLDAFMQKLFTIEDLGETGEYVLDVHDNKYPIHKVVNKFNLSMLGIQGLSDYDGFEQYYFNYDGKIIGTSQGSQMDGSIVATDQQVINKIMDSFVALLNATDVQIETDDEIATYIRNSIYTAPVADEKAASSDSEATDGAEQTAAVDESLNSILDSMKIIEDGIAKTNSETLKVCKLFMGGNIETITDTVDNWKYDPDSQEQIATGETAATQNSETATSDESSEASSESEQTVSLEDIAGQTTDSAETTSESQQN